MSEELPNGFTGFNREKPKGFVSAREAIDSQVGANKSASSSKSVYPNTNRYAATSSTYDIGAKGAFQYARDHDRPEEGEAEFDLEKLKSIPDIDRRWSWVSIDLGAIRHNASTVKRLIGPQCRLMAVVKADAYGHGAINCAKAALSAGATYLGVATVQEAIELREASINVPILILSEPPRTSIPLLLAYKIMPSVYTPEFAIQYAETADAFGMRAPYHLIVNTGMNRVGVRFDEVLEFINQVNFHRALDLEGTFTHFATADSSETLDFQIQTKRFTEAIMTMRSNGINPGIVHAANSAAAIRYPEVRFDMVRLGISLYGFHPCPQTRSLIDLHPAMSVHACITDVRMVPMGEGVSYGLNYRSPGSVKICTLPIGYADGLRRGLSGNTDVIMQGQRCRQVGNICMDQCMFEVDMRTYGSRPKLNPQIGDEVLLVGHEGDAVVTIDDMADKLGTIQHEVAIGFGCSRLARVYE